METKRVTMREVALRAGVHCTTVSRALLRDPSIPVDTSDRIRRLADEMGYAPDPMVSALNAYRSRISEPCYQGNIAWVTNGFTREGWNTCKTFALHREGARKRAAELGYKLEDFWLREPGMTGRRASDILCARNIRGLLLPPQPRYQTRVDLQWARFAAVTFGYTLAAPRLHLVSNNTFLSMQTAVARARELGYRRLGLIISPAANHRVQRMWRAGFVEQQQDWPARERLPVCLYENVDSSILRWMDRHRPDAVVCHEPGVLALLKKNGYRIPRDVGYLTQSIGDYPAEVSGVDENALEVGVAAVDLVVSMIHRSEWGIPAIPRRILSEGTWHAGRTLPRKRGVTQRKTRGVTEVTEPNLIINPTQ